MSDRQIKRIPFYGAKDHAHSDRRRRHWWHDAVGFLPTAGIGASMAMESMEIWSSLMAGEPIERQSDQTIPAMRGRFSVAETRLQTIAGKVQAENGWDHLWTDHLDNPPREKTFGTVLDHITTHSMHHRAQVLYMLRLAGVQELPEGDVFSWENNTKQG